MPKIIWFSAIPLIRANILAVIPFITVAHSTPYAHLSAHYAQNLIYCRNAQTKNDLYRSPVINFPLKVIITHSLSNKKKMIIHGEKQLLLSSLSNVYLPTSSVSNINWRQQNFLSCGCGWAPLIADVYLEELLIYDSLLRWHKCYLDRILGVVFVVIARTDKMLCNFTISSMNTIGGAYTMRASVCKYWYFRLLTHCLSGSKKGVHMNFVCVSSWCFHCTQHIFHRKRRR